jgi:hypothetical protein
VHDVVVVGGASRMTGLRDRLEAMFPAHFQTSLHMTDATINAVSLSLSLLWTRRSKRPGTCPAVCRKVAILRRWHYYSFVLSLLLCPVPL